MKYSQPRLASPEEANGDAPDRQAAQEGPGTIEGVDDPDVLTMDIAGSLLAKDAVAGIRALEMGHQQLLYLQIGLADQGAISLARALHAIEMAKGDPPCLANPLHHQVDFYVWLSSLIHTRPSYHRSSVRAKVRGGFAAAVGGMLQSSWRLWELPRPVVWPFEGKTVDLLELGVKDWGLTLSPQEVEAFGLYYRELVVWNERINLTSVTDYEAVQVKHFLDSLSCLQILDPLAPDARCIDIGAGAGFPGLPLKMVRPSIRLTLLESVGKKVRFLEHMVKALGLEDVHVLRGRAEELGRHPDYREVFDVTLARAVAQMAVLVEYALPLLRVGGVFVAQKGAEVGQEVESALPAMKLLGGRFQELRRVDLPGLDDPRHLVVVEKVCSTPDRYPRRPGIPTKRPITGL